MADKFTPTPKQKAVIRHWGLYGQRGTMPKRRVTASDWKTEGFKKPQWATWDVAIQPHQLPLLLLGFLPSTGSQVLPDADWVKVGQPMRIHGFMSASPEKGVNASDDKLFVYADGPDANGDVRLHVYRSWSGHKSLELQIKAEPVVKGQVSSQSAVITHITWESDEKISDSPTEEKAKETAIEVCRWVLSVDLQPHSRVDYNRYDLEEALEGAPRLSAKVSRFGPGGRSFSTDEGPWQTTELSEVLGASDFR